MKTKLVVVALGAALMAAVASGAYGAEPAVRVQALQFAPGASALTLKGHLRGYEMAEYTLPGRAGQAVHVHLATRHGANYFNVLPPGSEAAVFVGPTSGNDWHGVLPVDGEYRIRVFLMRSAARRNEQANYTLSVAIAPGSGDAKVAGTPYHATGKVPCSIGPDPKGSAQCAFGVIRQGAGKAELHIAPPGFEVGVHKDQVRVLHFAGPKVTSANAAEPVVAQLHGDTWSVAVSGFYFYEIPEAVINGG